MASILGKYKKIFADINKGEKARVYLLKGKEKFIMEQFAEKIVSSIINESTRPFNLNVTYGKDVDIEEFLSTANSFPFMADKRVLVLKELEHLHGTCEQLSEYCVKPAPSSIVIFIYNTHDQTGRKINSPRGFQKFENIIKKNGSVIEFGKLFKSDLQHWIIQRAKNMGVQMSTDASRILVENIGDNIYDLKNELDKIAIIYQGEKVDSNDVMKVVGSYKFNGIYDLIDSLRPDREAKTLTILFKIINSGTERSSVIVYSLIRNFITLLNIKQGYKAGGFWYDKREKQAKLYSKREIVLWLENLRLADLKIKSSSLPDDLIITSCFVHSFENKLA
jgi:DNA polymerase-3 subunit delta